MFQQERSYQLLVFTIFHKSITFVNAIHQVEILLRELCRLHTVSLPPDLDNLTLALQVPPELLVCNHSLNKIEDMESDPEDVEDAVVESEQESEGDEDLPLEMDDARSVNKVIFLFILLTTTNL